MKIIDFSVNESKRKKNLVVDPLKIDGRPNKRLTNKL